MIRLKNIILLLAFPLFISAQDQGCDGIRYLQSTFDSIEVSTEKFGENLDVNGNTKELFMDVYTPYGDTLDNRPLIVLAYGGAFVAGEREDMDFFCRLFASRGYTAATIDYRLLMPSILNFPDSLDFLDIAFKAVADMKGSIRHMRMLEDNGNPYGINSDLIFVGGVSAGAITALQTAYVDASDSIPDYLATIIDANGGIEGNTGDSLNMTYSSAVSGVLNASGALYRTDWLDEGEVPVVSYHGTADEVVPYNKGLVTFRFSGIPFEIITLNGSGNIHAQAETVGVESSLVTVIDGEHTDIYTDSIYADSLVKYLDLTLTTFEGIICDMVSNTEDVPSSIRVQVFPNPVDDMINIQIEEELSSLNVYLFDAVGRLVSSQNLDQQRDINIPRQGLPNGIYYLRLQGAQKASTYKLVFN